MAFNQYGTFANTNVSYYFYQTTLTTISITLTLTNQSSSSVTLDYVTVNLQVDFSRYVNSLTKVSTAYNCVFILGSSYSPTPGYPPISLVTGGDTGNGYAPPYADAGTQTVFQKATINAGQSLQASITFAPPYLALPYLEVQTNQYNTANASAVYCYYLSGGTTLDTLAKAGITFQQVPGPVPPIYLRFIVTVYSGGQAISQSTIVYQVNLQQSAPQTSSKIAVNLVLPSGVMAQVQQISTS